MGTSAITTVKDNENRTIMVLYRQFDGYQDCHGKELKNFLNTKIMVNGIPYGDERNIANGMCCLAAQMVVVFKTEVGKFYVYPEGIADKWVDYSYTIYPSDKSDSPALKIKVESYNELLFDGPISEYEAKDILQ